jgi:fibronectin-binding autotransporter adhesin
MTVIPRLAGGPARRRRGGAALVGAGLAVLVLAATVRVAGAACTTSICVGTATACTISGTNTVDDDCILDFTGKDVTLASGAVLKTASDGQNFTVITDDFDVIGTIQDKGAPVATPLSISSTGFFKVRSTGTVNVSNGGSVTVSAVGAVTLDGPVTADGGGALLDGGFIDITSSGSTLSGGGAVHSTGSTTGSGGDVSLTSSTSSASLTGALTANGASGATGGTIAVVSATTMSISGAVNANGGNGNDGGEVDLTSGGNMTITGNITANGNGSFAFGGTISIDSGGTFSTTKHLHAVGDSDGDGGSIDVLAVGSAQFDDTVRVNGGASGGTGGAISIDAASALIKADWQSNGGTESDGGTIAVTAETGTFELQSTASLNSGGGGGGGSGDDIDISAAGTITQSGPISSTGAGGGDGATVTITGSANVTLAANIDVTGAGTDSSGGTIDVTGGDNHTVTISKTLDARSTSNAGFFDGDIFVAGCNVSVPATAGVLKTRNTNVGAGRNFVTYKGSFTIAGSSLADDPAATSCTTPSSGNIFRCRCVDTSPADGVCDSPARCVSNPTTTGATINPTALICPIPLPACS